MFIQKISSLIIIALSQFCWATGNSSLSATTSEVQAMNQTQQSPKKMAFNVGYSQLERSSYQGSAASGLSFEGQYSLHQRALATATLFHYDYANSSGSSNFQMVAVGGEVQPIQAELQGGYLLFSAVTTGVSYVFNSNSQVNLYYGAGLGFRFSDEIGLRFDVKTGPNYITSNTLALVGYY